MGNNYMFVCPKCLETYSSDSLKVNKCPNCHSDVALMPISVSEWREMNELQKDDFKRKFVEERVNHGFYYKNVETTPFAWYKFTFYFRIPSLIVMLFAGMQDPNSFNYLNIPLVLAGILFMMNAKKRNKTALYSAIAADIIYFLYGLFLISSSYIAPGFGSILFSVLEFVYYWRRKNLFTDDYEQFMSEIGINNETHNNETPITDNLNPKKEVENSTLSIDPGNITLADLKQTKDAPSDISIAKTEEEQKPELEIQTEKESTEIQVEAKTIKTNKPMVKYRRKCGRELLEGTMYCRYCGTKI